MADQENRGGKKKGKAGAPGQTEEHQGTGAHPRPPEGQPGGPKPHQGETRSEKHPK
jgi:hypothetical protein